MIETINKIVRTQRLILSEFGREATPEELAQKLRMPLDKVRKVLKISKEPVSLEKPVGDEEDSSLGDFIEDTKALAPLEQAIKSNLGEATTKILSTLTPRKNEFKNEIWCWYEYRSYIGRGWFTIFCNKRKNQTN